MEDITVTYIGWLDPRGESVVKVCKDSDPERDLPLYLNEVNHSPTGFAWGYGGSGPAQLAYAILRNYLGEHNIARSKTIAKALYQRFKWDVIAPLKWEERFTVCHPTIDKWLSRELALPCNIDIATCMNNDSFSDD